MENIPIQASIEGQHATVVTDWVAIMAMLKKRGLDQEELMSIYAQLTSCLRVTTRGLTLSKIADGTSIEGVTREPKISSQDFLGLVSP